MNKELNPPREGVVERFLRYVRVDTQSQEEQSVTPSTAKQWDLARMLAAELKELGASDIRLSGHCMVYANIPATVDKDIPVIGFLAHVDTSPAVTGRGVNPIIHRNYQGGDMSPP
jgi:tripeptide aminopeptidase